MSIEQAIIDLEKCQSLLASILENVNDLTAKEDFKHNLATAINLVEICTEDLVDQDEEL